MTDKEILYQIVEREISNVLGAINPSFRLFSDSLTGFVINFIDPYVDAFTKGSFPDAKINTKAAGEYVKSEVNRKVDEFMQKFEQQVNEENGL